MIPEMGNAHQHEHRVDNKVEIKSSNSQMPTVSGYPNIFDQNDPHCNGKWASQTDKKVVQRDIVQE